MLDGAWHLLSLAGKRKLRLAAAHPAHQEDRYRAGVAVVADILRQLADEVVGMG